MQMECTRAGAREPREGIERRAKAEAAPFETTRPMWVGRMVRRLLVEAQGMAWGTPNQYGAWNR